MGAAKRPAARTSSLVWCTRWPRATRRAERREPIDHAVELGLVVQRAHVADLKAHAVASGPLARPGDEACAAVDTDHPTSHRRQTNGDPSVSTWRIDHVSPGGEFGEFGDELRLGIAALFQHGAIEVVVDVFVEELRRDHLIPGWWFHSVIVARRCFA